MNIHEKLLKIQTELKAPKGRNAMNRYNYRNCEDILEAVKPLLIETKATLTIFDDLVLIGDRYYIQAVAVLTNVEKPEETVTNSAFAREAESKSSMDVSQITGATSSYARKYALNGLLCIDDTKDADALASDEKAPMKASQKPSTQKPAVNEKKISKTQIERITAILEVKEVTVPAFKKSLKRTFGKDNLEELTEAEANGVIEKIGVA